jgi:sigma-E factor negative regulatory protein RseC
MTHPVATVISIAGSHAQVEVADSSTCPRCAAGKGCGAGVFGASRRSISLQVRVADGLQVVTGDRVYLYLAATDLVRAALLAYGAPLAGLLLASGLAYLLIEPLHDAMALVIAVAGLLAGGIGGRALARRDRCIRQFSPSINAHAGEEYSEDDQVDPPAADNL